MAFIFLVEDGTGLSNATSYVSISEASDLLFTDKRRYVPFFASQDSEKESVLSLATTYLDTRYKWEGSKTVNDSALRWPRTSIEDRDGIVIDSNTLPVNLKHATALLAALMIEDMISFSDGADTAIPAYPLQEIKVDVIELKYQIPEQSPAITSSEQVPDEIKYLLSYLGVATSPSQQFAKINK